MTRFRGSALAGGTRQPWLRSRRDWGSALGSVPLVSAALSDSQPPDPRDVAAPHGVPGTPGAFTEVRECAGPNGTTNLVYITLAPPDAVLKRSAGPVVPANLPCGPEDRIR